MFDRAMVIEMSWLATTMTMATTKASADDRDGGKDIGHGGGDDFWSDQYIYVSEWLIGL